MHPEVELAVRQMLADLTGHRLDRIREDSRVLEDLGIDGDDAVDLFERLEAQFGTDFAPLYARWKDHFGPEGFSLWNLALLLPPCLVGGAVAGKFDLGNLAGFAIALLLIVLVYGIAFWIAGRVRGRRGIEPLRVRDVISAVQAGSWPQAS